MNQQIIEIVRGVTLSRWIPPNEDEATLENFGADSFDVDCIQEELEVAFDVEFDQPLTMRTTIKEIADQVNQ